MRVMVLRLKGRTTVVVSDKVFKLGIGNDLGISYARYGFEVERSYNGRG